MKADLAWANCRSRLKGLIGALLVAAAAASAGGGELPDLSWRAPAPRLPAPRPSAQRGRLVNVRTVAELQAAVERARSGDTIAIADGTYHLSKLLDVRTSRVVLRGKTGRREKVVLDGSRIDGVELLAITGAAEVTIADLTVQNVRANAIKLNADHGASKVTIHNCVIRNAWQRGVKSPLVPAGDRPRLAPRDCRIQHCLFYNDRPKELADDSADTYGGDYVGGIDAMSCRNWSITDNVFYGIRGRTGQARGAVFLWQDSRDCVVERNVVIDCDTGICLGNSSRGDDPLHAVGCIVRNNFVAQAPETGILADYTSDCRIVHNTIWDPHSRKQRLIRIVHDNEGLVVANNLIIGSPIRPESSSKIEVAGNVIRAGDVPLVNPALGNLHLAGPAEGIVNLEKNAWATDKDFDGQSRDGQPDIGADELSTK